MFNFLLGAKKEGPKKENTSPQQNDQTVPQGQTQQSEKGFASLVEKVKRDKQPKGFLAGFRNQPENEIKIDSLFGVVKKKIPKVQAQGGGFASVGPGGGLAALLKVGRSLPSSIAISLPTITRLVQHDELEMNLPDVIDKKIVKQFLMDMKGDTNELEQYLALPQEKLKSVILNFYKSDKQRQIERNDTKKFLSEVMDMPYDEISLMELERVRKILETYSITFVNFFLVTVEGQNGLTKLKDLLQKKFLEKLKLSRNEKFDLPRLDELFLTEIILSIKAMLRNQVGYVEIVKDKTLLRDLFFTINAFKGRKQVNFRTEIVQLMSLIMIMNEMGSEKMVEALEHYEDRNCQKININKFTEFVEVLEDSKSQQYLRTCCTFLNSLLASCDETQKNKFINEIKKTKLEKMLKRVIKSIDKGKIKKINLKKHVEVLYAYFDPNRKTKEQQLAEAEAQKLKALVTPTTPVIKNKASQIASMIFEKMTDCSDEKLLFFGQVLSDLKENWEKKIELYRAVVEGKEFSIGKGESNESEEKPDVVAEVKEKPVEENQQVTEEKKPEPVEEKQQVMEEKKPETVEEKQQEQVTEEKKPDEEEKTPVEEEGGEDDDDDDGPPPPPPMSDEEDDDDDDDDGPPPPPPGDDDDDDDDDDGPPPPPPGDDDDDGDGPPPPPMMGGSKKKKKDASTREIEKIFKASKKAGVGKVLHMDKISKRKVKESIFVVKGINKGLENLYNEDLVGNFQEFMKKPKKKEASGEKKKKKKKKDEKESLLNDSKLEFKASIAVKTIKMDHEKIKECILNFDEDNLPAGIIQRINNVVPDNYDQQFKRIASYKGKIEDIDASSQFFLVLSSIPLLKRHLLCWNWKIVYRDLTKSIPMQLEDYNKVVELLKNSDKLHTFLKYCLLIANMMQRKEAVLGFKFKSLEKMIMTKSGSGRSLLIFLIGHVRKQKEDRKCLRWGDEFEGIIDQVADLNTDLIKEDIGQIEKEIKNLEGVLRVSKNEKFIAGMGVFLGDMRQDLYTYRESFKKSQEGIKELSKLYQEDEDYIKGSFFKDVKNFILELNRSKIQYKKFKSADEKKKLREAKMQLMKKKALKTIDIASIQNKMNSGEIFGAKTKRSVRRLSVVTIDKDMAKSQSELEASEVKEIEENEQVKKEPSVVDEK